MLPALVRTLALLGLARADPAAPGAVILIGTTGAGKSETGNTLVGRKAFEVSGSIKSQTRDLQAETASYSGKDYSVIDTPGFFDSALSADDIVNVLERLASLAGRNIVGLVFVVPYGRFSDPQVRAFNLFRRTFGTEGHPYTSLVFTSCGQRTEAEITEEVRQLCVTEPASNICTVLGEVGYDRVVTMGYLDDTRRVRDRSRFFELVEDLLRRNGGRPYDHVAFQRQKATRDAMERRIAAITDPSHRRLLDVLLEQAKNGASVDDELRRALERAEGLTETSFITVDFEDGTLGPFELVPGTMSTLKRPMPVRYQQMRGFASIGGGHSFLHTAADSGVRLRDGDKRVAVLRTAPFTLGRGEVRWDATGRGGYVALCRAGAGRSADCIQRRVARESTTMEGDRFLEGELSELSGEAVYIEVVDDQTRGWGFVAFDNLVYPSLDVVNSSSVEEASAVRTTNAPSRAPEPAPAPAQNDGKAAHRALGAEEGIQTHQQPPASATPPAQPKVLQAASGTSPTQEAAAPEQTEELYSEEELPPSPPPFPPTLEDSPKKTDAPTKPSV